MVGTSPNDARKMNISSARDRKVSFCCGELDTENDGEASIGKTLSFKELSHVK